MADLRELMTRKAGPLPVWAWTFISAAGIAGVMMFTKKGKTSGGTSAAGGPGGEFQSSQAQTKTDAQGNTTTSQYSATGPLTGVPGFLTNQASPMPYSLGDIYVNTTLPNQTVPPAAQITDVTQVPRQFLPPLVSDHSQDISGSPWFLVVSKPGETWQDITTRAFAYAQDFAHAQEKDKPRIQAVTNAIISANNRPGSSAGNGPAPYQAVFFR